MEVVSALSNADLTSDRTALLQVTVHWEDAVLLQVQGVKLSEQLSVWAEIDAKSP